MNKIIRVKFLLIFPFLFFQGSLFSQECKSSLNSSSDTLVKECNIYSIILSGKELNIKNYFNTIAYDDLSNQCCNEIVDAINKLNSKDKVTHTIWILEEVKNRSIDIRGKVYLTLLRVDYPKPAYVLKPMINSYFTSFREPDDSLAKQVNALHWNMIR